MSRTISRTKLEPLAGPLAAVALAHVLLGMLLWIFLPLWKTAHPTHPENALLDWKTPDDFLLGRQQPSPPPAAPKSASSAPVHTTATAPVPKSAPEKPAPPVKPSANPVSAVVSSPSPPPGPLTPANRYITLSSRSGESGAGMGAVDEAVQQAYMKEWVAPAIQLVPTSQRGASLNVSVGRDGTVLEAKMLKAADGAALDASIKQAAERVKKIPVSLPSSFPKARYDLQVNFQIE